MRLSEVVFFFLNKELSEPVIAAQYGDVQINKNSCRQLNKAYKTLSYTLRLL